MYVDTSNTKDYKMQALSSVEKCSSEREVSMGGRHAPETAAEASSAAKSKTYQSNNSI